MAVVPDWTAIREGLAALDAHIGELTVPQQAQADQIRAFARDFFDTLGVDVTDPTNVYVAIVTASLMVELSEAAVRGGKGMAPAHFHGVAATARTLAAVLAAYVPPEARP